MAGYSRTPLLQKLGIKPGMRVAFLDAPRGYRAGLGPLPERVRTRIALRGPLDCIQVFVSERAALERKLPALLRALAPAGMLWVSWPKKSSRQPTDLTEDVVRAIALAAGVVDVKVCAVDEVWSGLKLVRRLRDRPRS